VKSYLFALAVVVVVLAAPLVRSACADARGDIEARDYASIQAAIDANPGRMIHVAAGEYQVDEPIEIHTSETGLFGYGTIIQTNPDAAIVNIRGTEGTRLDGLTLTRPDGKRRTHRAGLHLARCDRFRLTNLRILDNHSDNAAVRIENGHHGRIEGCEIVNYKRIGVDDRTASPLYGYAFHAIIGDGIIVTASTYITIAHNTVAERRVDSSPAAKQQYQLGQLTEGRQPTRKGQLAPAGDYVPHWHQGSAIVVTSPEQTRYVLVTGNFIENAAQGVDLHADHVTFSANIIHTAFVGIKCMHGARNVVITGNNVSQTDLWGLVMQPGTASHAAENGRPPNVTRGNIIANNVFADCGYGRDYHNWKSSDSRNVLQFESGPMPDNPPLGDIVVQGNIIYDPGRDGPVEDGNGAGPRFNYAVFIDPRLDLKSFRFTGNLFHPGQRGVSNVAIEP